MKRALFLLPIAVSLVAPAVAFADPIDDLTTQVAVLTLAVKQLQTRVTTLETSNSSLQTRLTAAESTVASLDAKLQRVTVANDGHDLFLDEANLHVRSGSGATNGPVNGWGNVIIGYDETTIAYPFYDSAGTGVEKSGPSQKTGSHNLIVGDGHSYTSYGGVVFGHNNRVTAPYASASGGQGHIAGGAAVSVTGGANALARGAGSTVVGGYSNRVIAAASYGVALGGYGNTVNNAEATVLGGTNNKAEGAYSSVVGGGSNTASGEGSVVVGGQLNRTISTYSSILAGAFNSVSGTYGAIVGGAANQIGTAGAQAAVLGGALNYANHNSSVVTGGRSGYTDRNDDLVP